MKNNYFKFYKPNFLIYLILLVSISIILINKLLVVHWGISISIIGFTSFLLLLIDKFLWKYKPFSWFFWVQDFSGNYEGELEYQYIDENCEKRIGVLKHIKKIHQTGSNITINSFTIKPNGEESSLSTNNTEVSVIKEEDDTFKLVYSYLNDGNQQESLNMHYGTEVIKFINDNGKQSLSGYYYTNRLPFQTKGKFKNLKYINNNLKHEF